MADPCGLAQMKRLEGLGSRPGGIIMECGYQNVTEVTLAPCCSLTPVTRRLRVRADLGPTCEYSDAIAPSGVTAPLDQARRAVGRLPADSSISPRTTSERMTSTMTTSAAG